MPPDRLSEFILRVFIAGSFVILLIANQPAQAESKLYDGLYSGPATVTYGTQPVCGSGGEISITVAGARIDHKFGDFPLKLDISERGYFSGKVAIGAKHGAVRVMRTRGKIVNSLMTSNLSVSDLRGRTCAYQWSLHKQ
jgi:hypothetical protein